MHAWQVGEVNITRVVELEFPVSNKEQSSFMPNATPEALAEVPWLQPHFVNEEGLLKMSIHALLVEAPGIRLVVDTCIGNDKPRGFTGGRALQTSFLKRFADTGWTRESVTHVVCTHLHVDHVGWNTMLDDSQAETNVWVPTFPNARYLLGKKEYEFWSQSEEEGQRAIMADSVKPIFDAGLVDLVEMDHRISSEIALRPTPGHTPGHVSVTIASQGQQALITGDTMHHPVQIARPSWCVGFDEDQTAAASTRQSLLQELVDSKTLVIGTHFAAPTAGHIVNDGSAYLLKSELAKT